MSLKKWKNEFKKQHFINVLKNVRRQLMREFDYTRAPYLIERKLEDAALMVFADRGERTAIFYDYAKFKRHYGDCDKDVQMMYAVSTIAHEMRHYFQHRQISATNPIVKEKILKKWEENKPKFKAKKGENSWLKSYYMKPRELDAQLFAYTFVADNLDQALIGAFYNFDHYKQLKKLHRKYGGSMHRKIFSREITKTVKQNNKNA